MLFIEGVINDANRLRTIYCVFRNVLVESARISRGPVEPLSNLKATGFDAIVFPGGFGAAKNLQVFAQRGIQYIMFSF